MGYLSFDFSTGLVAKSLRTLLNKCKQTVSIYLFDLICKENINFV
ncbi:hypothetical protein CKA32_005447 [Geitlerinema sp. FC II]|nr:hypothetical protein CKA32_005447 [Geitlerinema sp. FC II]